MLRPPPAHVVSAIFVKSSGQVTLVNSTVSGNAAGRGGAIESNGSLTIWNGTIVDNVASAIGGIVTGGSLYLRNSIVANNTDTDDNTSPDPNCKVGIGGAVLLSGANLSNEDSCGDDVLAFEDLGLGPLANNGGPTKTHALLLGSPAIDGGRSCTEATDQRHVARNQGSSCDVGAFEFTDFATVTVTIGPNIAVNAKTGAATVTGTMQCSAPVSVRLTVSLSQTQKTTGRFSTIVEASTIPTLVVCGSANSAFSWSFTLTPQSGKFEPGAATGTASVLAPIGFVAPTVTVPLKLFQVK